MYKQQILWLLILILLIGQPAWACCRRSCAQPVTNHGKFVQRSNASVLAWKNAAANQTQVINQYMKLGSQFESKKQWADAEKSFHYVLQVVALRDGPGSPANLPVLEHLVTASKVLKKLDQATDYQETALRMRQAQPKPNQAALLNDQLSLADLYIQKQDYIEAKSVLKDSVAMYSSQPSLPHEKRLVTYQNYAKVLRQLHRDSEAEAVEAAANITNTQSDSAKLAESKPITVSQNATDHH